MVDLDLRDLPLVLLSHRGPATFGRGEDGRTVTRGSGGLVTALTGLAGHLRDAVWVCAATTEEDAVVMDEHGGEAVRLQLAPELRIVGEHESTDCPTLSVRPVTIDRDRHEQFYSVIANPLLWFLQHGLYGLAESPDITAAHHRAFDDGYAAVNAVFADVVAHEVESRGGRALVLLQDYHFYLVAAQLRRRCPDAIVSHFIHIPWPGPDLWRVLPPQLRDPLLAGLLGNDVVAFHTRRFARNFLLCAQELLGLPIDLDRMTVTVGNREVAARWYPISIDVDALESVAGTPEVADRERALATTYQREDRKLLLRVDRTDPSKNIVRGFRAYDTMLTEHPELAGQVTFLAMLQPSRQDVPEYAAYLGAIGAVVAEVNARHGKDDWQPIDLRLVSDFALAVAAYRRCDALLVNALADGMNLVAKEVTVLNQRGATLLLSENTGAFEELGDFAIDVYPFDIGQQAQALHQALTMPAPERKRRLAGGAAVVRENDVGRWLGRQLTDLAAVRAGHVLPTPPSRPATDHGVVRAASYELARTVGATGQPAR